MREGPDFATGKDSAQTPEREGEEKQEKDPGESEPGGRMVQ